MPEVQWEDDDEKSQKGESAEPMMTSSVFPPTAQIYRHDHQAEALEQLDILMKDPVIAAGSSGQASVTKVKTFENMMYYVGVATTIVSVLALLGLMAYYFFFRVEVFAF